MAWMARHIKDFASLRGKVMVLARSREAYFRDDELSGESATRYVKTLVVASMRRARRYTACAYKGAAGASRTACAVDGHDDGGDDGGGSDGGDGDGQSDSHHEALTLGQGNVVVDFQQNKSTEKSSIAARNYAVRAVVEFFAPFFRQEVAA